VAATTATALTGGLSRPTPVTSQHTVKLPQHIGHLSGEFKLTFGLGKKVCIILFV